MAVEITVVAEAAVTPPGATATRTPQAVAVNAGLRSNTGVGEVPAAERGSTAVAVGGGMLLFAGAGGVALARTRRRPAEGGTCGS